MLKQNNNKKNVKSKEIKSWYQDRYIISIIQRNILLLICFGLIIALISSMLVIKAIVEKNAIEPYVIEHNTFGGMPVAVQSESIQTFVNANSAILEYFIMRYIDARESYDFSTYNYNYNNVVKSMSTTNIFSQFLQIVGRGQQTSPINVLGQNGTIDIIIKKILTKVNNNTISLRVVKRVLSKSGDIKSMTHYQINLHYIFDNKNMTYSDIQINPLGVKVDNYEMIEEKTFVSDELFQTKQ